MKRIVYHGLLYNIPGQVCGEIPDFPGIVAYGTTEEEVTSTLKGLLEEHVESMVEDDDDLPAPAFDNPKDLRLGSDVTDPRTVALPIFVKSVSGRDLFGGSNGTSHLIRPAKLREVHFNAVILKTSDHLLGGHFPDLPGAFTTGVTEEETSTKLQDLLECYVGGLVKDGMAIPEPKFQSLEDLDMTPEEQRDHPPVCITSCTVAVPY